ncbi:hypothetical protein [Pyxidicoccus trucidator]|uniref:hypothetical protein n=1 Tax=Pyxidicoccus trucidator TaxID=2709662 RepID=UPI0013D915DE|nr:hypothetical protein [Pyxidicoccus trucidator]
MCLSPGGTSGDSVWFWCPGCGANFRSSWNIKSGTDEPGYAIAGSIAGMGLGGMLVNFSSYQDFFLLRTR